jgi:hypothetical protein
MSGIEATMPPKRHAETYSLERPAWRRPSVQPPELLQPPQSRMRLQPLPTTIRKDLP